MPYQVANRFHCEPLVALVRAVFADVCKVAALSLHKPLCDFQLIIALAKTLVTGDIALREEIVRLAEVLACGGAISSRRIIAVRAPSRAANSASRSCSRSGRLRGGARTSCCRGRGLRLGGCSGRGQRCSRGDGAPRSDLEIADNTVGECRGKQRSAE